VTDILSAMLLSDMFAEMEAKGQKVAWVLCKDRLGAMGCGSLWGAQFVQDGTLESGTIVLKSNSATLQFAYWHPPGSLTNGHFWVLKRLMLKGGGLWGCRQCGLSAESKSVVGFRVAIPHWADLKGGSCEQTVVDLVHAL